MNHNSPDFLEILELIKTAQTDNLLDLMKIAGRTGPKAFRGGNWSECDFSNCDVRNYDFSNCDMTGAIFKGALTSDCIWDGVIGLDLTGAILRPLNERGLTIADFEKRMREAKNFAEANEVYHALREAKLTATVALLNTMMSKAKVFPQALHTSNLFKTDWLAPDKFTYAMLMKLAESEEVAHEWGLKMLDSGTKADRTSFNIWLSKLRTPDIVSFVFEKMTSLNIGPDIFTFNTLIGNAESLALARGYFEMMESFGVKPDAITMRSLLDSSRNFPSCMEILNQMHDLGFDLDIRALNTVLKYASGDDQIKTVFAYMAGHDIEPDLISFNTLISKPGDFGKALSVLDQISSAGLIPDDYTFRLLTEKAKDKANVRDMLRLRCKFRIEFTSRSAPSLAQRALALKVISQNELETIRKSHESDPSLMGARLAASFAVNVREGVEWVSVFHGGRTSFNEASVIVLANQIHSVAEAEQLIMELDKTTLLHQERFYKALFRRLASRTKATEILRIYSASVMKIPKALDEAVYTYLSDKKQNEALRIALSYPFMSNCNIAIRKAGLQAVAYFEGFLADQENEATYALGYAHKSLGNKVRAIESFNRAIELASSEKRIADIKTQLAEMN